jgi:hypothetical protein
MVGDPSLYRQRALVCANRAAGCGAPAAHQKFADLAILWLMLATELEDEVRRRPAKASGFGAKREPDA